MKLLASIKEEIESLTKDYLGRYQAPEVVEQRLNDMAMYAYALGWRDGKRDKEVEL